MLIQHETTETAITLNPIVRGKGFKLFYDSNYSCNGEESRWIGHYQLHSKRPQIRSLLLSFAIPRSDLHEGIEGLASIRLCAILVVPYVLGSVPSVEPA